MELKINENIKQCRKDRGLTQEQLAEALGVTAGAVHKWENALSLPEIAMLVEIADFFEVSVDYLLGYSVEKSGVDEFIERLHKLMMERRLTEGIREAEKGSGCKRDRIFGSTTSRIAPPAFTVSIQIRDCGRGNNRTCTNFFSSQCDLGREGDGQ